MKRLPVIAPLALAIVLAVGGASVHAASTDAAQEAELEAARADLHRAAARVAELSKHVGQEPDMVIESQMMRGPVLGVILEPVEGEGVQIAAVTPDSAAHAAGLRADDRLTTINGKSLAGATGQARLADARARLRRIEAGKPVAIGYLRDGRAAKVNVTPRMGEHMLMVHDGEQMMSFHGEPQVSFSADGERMVSAKMVRVAPAGVAPDVHREIVRLDRGAPCRDEDCRMDLLEEAFRWNGLNLASVDPVLGRYFGTDRGVLVLSLPDSMGGLQPGDVVLKLDGKDVNTPREVMSAAHTHKPGSAVPVEYLRDRRRATTTMTMPERRMLRLPTPPTPPPAPPAPGAHAAPHALAAPPAPPTPPAPPAAPRAHATPRALVAPPSPPPAPAAPPAPPEPPAAPPPPSDTLL
ncbi:PDZ domain-containing protein [Agrilutibacter solisilvae]|uniref:PDZ domain-containing protein n=1 Tax=Agrilutibacter solisilvae TaxID=2763317 RepID=A0A974Y1K4_9GAMM|nr:PDZ domain-containing protein [Lysobacter solisilvae]QSX79761.1 PDZ domain-containing protein [Lysobacter solisilvae]